MPTIGDIAMYGKKVIRTCKCWRCKHRGEYEWRTGPKIKNSKKIYCAKTKRWGSPKRAYYCTKFENNTSVPVLQEDLAAKIADEAEDVEFGRLMQLVSDAQGQEYVELNERLKSDPAAAVPVEVDRKAMAAIERAFEN